MTNTVQQMKLIKDDFSNIATPFEHDVWDRKELANKLTAYIESLKMGATIAINAEWGAGKTWFVKHWEADLKSKEFKVIYLDAFANDYLDDPFLLISMAILNQLEGEDPDTVSSIKKNLITAYRAVLPHTPKLLFSLFATLSGAGFLAKSVNEAYESIKEGSGDLGEKVAEKLDAALEEHLTNQVQEYDKEEKSLEYFKNELKKAANTLEKPIVFMIDELDRCKPEFSIRLIERIKHFFDVPNVVFILTINKDQLEESINSYYGFTNKNAYLDKFIDFSVRLNSSKNINYRSMISEYSNKLGINSIVGNDFYLLCSLFKPNSRQLIKIMQKISFLNLDINSQDGYYGTLYLICNELNLIKNIHDDYCILEVVVKKLQNYLFEQYSINLKEVTINYYTLLFNAVRTRIEMNETNFHFLFDLLNYCYCYIDNDKEAKIEFSISSFKSKTVNANLPINVGWDHHINGGFLIPRT